jgi:hypothetical protein
MFTHADFSLFSMNYVLYLLMPIFRILSFQMLFLPTAAYGYPDNSFVWSLLSNGYSFGRKALLIEWEWYMVMSLIPIIRNELFIFILLNYIFVKTP